MGSTAIDGLRLPRAPPPPPPTLRGHALDPNTGATSVDERYVWNGHQSAVGTLGPNGDLAAGEPVRGPLWLRPRRARGVGGGLRSGSDHALRTVTRSYQFSATVGM